MTSKILSLLEYDKILEMCASYASSPTAKDFILSLTPATSYEDALKLLNETEEADKILYTYSISPNFAFDDVSFALERASVLSILTMGELLRVARVLKVSRNLKATLSKVNDESIVLLKEKTKNIYFNKVLEDEIFDSILSETEMSDNASVELKNIRRKIRQTGEAIKQKLSFYVTSGETQKYLQDNIVTIRNDRYVIPVKSEFRGSIPGLVHDQSSSKATLYIEPMQVVELNNDLKGLLSEEQSEIERILRIFTTRVSVDVAYIKETYKVIAEMDVIFSKATFAYHLKAVKPILNNKGYINIIKGRHPLIDKNKVVPVSMWLGRDFDMLFITGPNTGGKTVTLKIAGLFTLMVMSGLFIPAAIDSELSFFNEVFADIGDEQSIEQSLSTFSSHISNVIKIIDGVNPQSLVLLDELGAGTDPSEGAALAVSIAEYLRVSGAKCLITTHYNELKEYAVSTQRVFNASMDFNPKTYEPTYRLIIGVPGASNALLIAEKLGLKKEITVRAREYVGSDKNAFEKVLFSLEEYKQDAEKEHIEAKRLREETELLKKQAEKEKNLLFMQREKLNESVKKETKRLVEASMEEADEIVYRMKELLDNPTESNLFEAQKLRKSLNKFLLNEDNEYGDEPVILKEEPDIGDEVYVKTVKAQGTLLSVNKRGEAKVQSGSITLNVKFSDLKKIKSDKSQEIKKSTASIEHNTDVVSSEVNLIGMNSEEAIYTLDSFLDQAIRGNLNEVRIIHGYGAGILKDAVWKRLRSHKNVKEFRFGRYGEGENGVTVATLK